MVNKMLHVGVLSSRYRRAANGNFIKTHIGANVVDGADSVCGLLEGSIVADVARQAAGGVADAAQLDNLLKLLAENGRLGVLADIAAQFDKLKAEVENSVDVVLTAAAPVDAAQQAKITAALKRRFGREINLHFKLDEKLIGGARLQADDLVIDGSIRTGLDKMASSLTN